MKSSGRIGGRAVWHVGRRVGAGLCVAILAAGAAQAQTTPANEVARDATWNDAPAPGAGALYARIGAGLVMPNRLDQSLFYNPDVAFIETPPDRRVTDFSDAAVGSIAVGFQFPAGTRTELEYRYAAPGIDRAVETGGFSNLAGGAQASELDPLGDARMHLLMSNIYLDLFRDKPISPFIGVGAGGAFFTNGLGDRDAAFAYQARAGASAHLAPGAMLSVEYVHTRTLNLVFGPDEFTPDGPVGPRARSGVLAAGSVILSLRKVF